MPKRFTMPSSSGPMINALCQARKRRNAASRMFLNPPLGSRFLNCSCACLSASSSGSLFLLHGSLGSQTMRRFAEGLLLENGRHHSRVHVRSEEHTSELQSPCNLVCRLLL